MNTKIMEGLIGAGTNMRQTDTTMRVFRDARRRGDQAAMERAMDYTGDFMEKAGEYQAKAQEGMEEDAREARERLKTQMEEAVETRREEQKAQETRREGKNVQGTAAAENGEEKKPIADSAQVSPEGLALLEGALCSEGQESETGVARPGAKCLDQPVIYTRTGAVSPGEQKPGMTVSV